MHPPLAIRIVLGPLVAACACCLRGPIPTEHGCVLRLCELYLAMWPPSTPASAACSPMHHACPSPRSPFATASSYPSPLLFIARYRRLLPTIVRVVLHAHTSQNTRHLQTAKRFAQDSRLYRHSLLTFRCSLAAAARRSLQIRCHSHIYQPNTFTKLPRALPLGAQSPSKFSLQTIDTFCLQGYCEPHQPNGTGFDFHDRDNHGVADNTQTRNERTVWWGQRRVRWREELWVAL